MTQYLEVMRDNAHTLGESSDRITLEPLALRCYGYRHASIAIEATGTIQYWNTEPLYSWIMVNAVHPLTRRELSVAERNYIKQYYLFLTFEQEYSYDETFIYNLFVANNGVLIGDEMLAARALLSPKNFAEHFKDYTPLSDTFRYERSQAESHLNQSIVGSWLIRRSSLNRPQDIIQRNLVKKLGLEYYVISFNTMYSKKGNIIQHSLILHRPGWGWINITDVGYTDTKVIPVTTSSYYPCFVDILLHILQRKGLCFVNHLRGYTQ